MRIQHILISFFATLALVGFSSGSIANEGKSFLETVELGDNMAFSHVFIEGSSAKGLFKILNQDENNAFYECEDSNRYLVWRSVVSGLWACTRYLKEETYNCRQGFDHSDSAKALATIPGCAVGAVRVGG